MARFLSTTANMWLWSSMWMCSWVLTPRSVDSESHRYLSPAAPNRSDVNTASGGTNLLVLSGAVLWCFVEDEHLSVRVWKRDWSSELCQQPAHMLIENIIDDIINKSSLMFSGCSLMRYVICCFLVFPVVPVRSWWQMWHTRKKTNQKRLLAMLVESITYFSRLTCKKVCTQRSHM